MASKVARRGVPSGNRALIFAGLVLAVLGRVLAEVPAAVEWHRSTLFPWIARRLQDLYGAFGGTVGELGAAGLVFLLVVLVARWRARGASVATLVLGTVVLAFYLSWGLAYRYPSLATRLAPIPFPPSPTPSAGTEEDDRLAALTERVARRLSRAAAELPDGPTAGDVLLARINTGLRAGRIRQPPLVDASAVSAVDFGPVKLSRISPALSRLQISGYYFPWTGEAQINAEMPGSLWPRVAAHEQAHQRGIARENEATVVGLLVCLKSPDPLVFYSGALGLYAALDRELFRADPEARARVVALLPERAIRDFGREAEFWKRYEGVAAAVSETVNDTYLKAQGVHSGIGSYNETTRLLLQAVATRSLELDLALALPDPVGPLAR